MAWTDEENKRILELEKTVAEQSTAIRNLASKRQLNHILTLLQKENAEINARLDALESQFNMLINK